MIKQIPFIPIPNEKDLYYNHHHPTFLLPISYYPPYFGKIHRHTQLPSGDYTPHRWIVTLQEYRGYKNEDQKSKYTPSQIHL